MPAGRPSLPPRATLTIRIDKNILLEMYALKPDLIDHTGGTKYGSMNSYITSLVVKDLEQIKARIREQAKKNG